jgi:hypothetical protein
MPQLIAALAAQEQELDYVTIVVGRWRSPHCRDLTIAQHSLSRLLRSLGRGLHWIEINKTFGDGEGEERRQRRAEPVASIRPALPFGDGKLFGDITTGDVGHCLRAKARGLAKVAE